MAERQWRVGGASVAGEGRTRNADRYGIARIRDASGASFLVLALADGAGSAPCGHRGAELALRGFFAAVRASARGRIVLTSRLLHKWRRCARRAVLLAPRKTEQVGDYASTLLGVVIGDGMAACIQVGDGAIVYEERPGRWRTVFWPQRGAFANETCFLASASTRDHAPTAISRSPRALALFSDGFEPLALHEPTRTVASGLFVALDKAICRGPHTDTRDNALRSLLSSRAVRRRTSDDCTLIIASDLDK